MTTGKIQKQMPGKFIQDNFSSNPEFIKLVARNSLVGGRQLMPSGVPPPSPHLSHTYKLWCTHRHTYLCIYSQDFDN